MQVNALFAPSQQDPIVITPDEDSSLAALRAYIEECKEELDKQLLTHGGILFRGFAIDGVANFQAVAKMLGGEPFEYLGGNSPRRRVVADVFTSTEYPSSEVISLHNEMSYLPTWPKRLFFYSEVPASSGGQTSLARSGEVLNTLSDRIVDKLREKKINYIRNFQSALPIGKTWQLTYMTQDRDEVESIVARQGSICRWQANGSLRISTPCSALTVHPQTGQEVWFNQAEQWHPSALDPAVRDMYEKVLGKGNLPHECEYGDGEPIDDDVLKDIRQAMNCSKLLFDWRRNDLLMIDNILMMHGREAFKGERKTLAYLSAT